MGKKSSKTKSTSEPWAPAQPILLGAGQQISDIVKNNQGNLQNLTSGVTGSVIPGIQGQIGQQGQQLQPGYDYINASLGGQYLNSNPANQQLQAIGNGQYLYGNAWTDAMTNYAARAAMDNVNSTFSAAGRTGSGNHTADLARGIDQAVNGVLFQNYQNERGLQQQALGQLGQNYNTALGYQAQAAGMLPGYSTSQFAGYSPLLGAYQLGGQLPYYGANALGNIGSLYGGFGTQTGTQPGGWLNGLLSAGASLGSAAIMASDRRLKTNIAKVGEASDGLGIHTWNWKADPDGPKVRGVIADEVERLRPWAFVKGFVGGVYDGVNYAALGSVA